MNKKRILALALAAAMAFPSNAFAAQMEPGSGEVPLLTEEDGLTAEEDNGASADGDGLENTPDAEESSMPSDTEDHTDNPDSTPGTDERAGGPEEEAGTGEGESAAPGTGEGEGSGTAPGTGEGEGSGTAPGTGEGEGSGTAPGTGEGGGSGAEPAPGGEDGEYTVIDRFKIDKDGVLAGVEGEEPLGAIVRIPDAVTAIPAGIFDTEKGSKVEIIRFGNESKLTEIGENAFKGSNLFEIRFKEGLKTVGNNSFADCKALVEVEFKSGLESIGDGSFAGCTSLETLNMPPEGVKSIGERAFLGCAQLSAGIKATNTETIGAQAFEGCSSLTSDDSSTNSAFGKHKRLTRIGSRAFKGCTGFKNLDMGEMAAETVVFEAGVFEECTGLAIIGLPEGLTEVPEETFKGCSALKKAILPAAVSKVKENAFQDCSQLEEVNFDSQDDESEVSTVQIADNAFPDRKENLKLRGYDGTVKEYAEKNGYNFESRFIPDENGFIIGKNGRILRLADGKELSSSRIEISAAVTAIPAGIFNTEKASRVREVSFAEGSKLTTIDADAFKGSALEKIEFNSPLESIGARCFDSCGSLTTVSWPQGVKSVGAEAFRSCSKLKDIDLTYAEDIGDQAFEYCTALTPEAFEGSSQALAHIGAHAFRGCTGFTILELSKKTAKTVTFGTGVFENCTGLVAVDLPEGLTEVSAEAFMGCTLLKKVEIPASVAAVRENAFKNAFTEAVKNLKDKEFIEVTIYNQDGPDGTSAVILRESSFPNLRKKLKLLGYDGTVEEHAENMGYTFETKFQRFTVKAEPATSGGKIKLSTALNGDGKESITAVIGRKVYVRLVPDTGKWVRPGRIRTDNEFEEFKLEKIEDNQVVYSFVLKASRRETEATVSAVFSNEQEMKNPAVNVEETRSVSATRDADGNVSALAFDKAGKEIRLFLNNGINKTDTESAPWMFRLSSSDTSVAKVSNDGTIRSVGMSDKNSCEIKIEPNTKKADLVGKGKTMTIKVTVYGKANPQEIRFSQFNDLTKGDVSTTDPTTNYPVIRFDSNRLAQKNRSFEAVIEVLDGDKDPVLVSAKWTVMDTSIATVANETTDDNRNRITVKKGVTGETTVSVSIQRPDGEKALVGRFIIQVVDIAPRLQEKNLIVNSNSELGAAFTLVPVYGYEVDEDSLVLKEQKGDRPYPEAEHLEIVDGRIKTKSKGRSPEQVYDKKLLIEGHFTDASGGGTFQTVINKLTVTNREPQPTLKRSGKINLFYTSGLDPDAGTVTFVQSLKGDEVDHYELVSEEHHQKWKNWADTGREDRFAENFAVSKDAEGNAVVTRKRADKLLQIKKKDVTSGYLYIYYKGYDAEKPARVKISIPTANTKPSYELSLKKATASTRMYGQSYEIKLQDKTTKEAVGLASSDVKLNTKTPRSLRNRIDTDNLVNANGNLSLTFRDVPKKGKVVFSVQKESWSKAINYTFTMSTTSALPKLKLSSSTINLLPDAGNQTATVKITWNQLEAGLSSADMYVESANSEISASYSENLIKQGAGSLTVYADSDLSRKSYKIYMTPTWNYGNGNIFTGKRVALTVKLADSKKKPSITLTGTESLNLLDRDRPAVYKAKMANIYGDIQEGDIQVEEWDPVYEEYTDGSKRFDVKMDNVERTFSIYAKKDEGARFIKGGSDKLAGNSYRLRFRCNINGEEVVSKAMTLGVVQKLPALDLDKESLVMYAGEQYDADRVHEITITKRTRKEAKILRVDWAKEATAARKDAIEIVGFDPDTGKLKLRLKNAARLKMETEYTLPFVAVCDGQMVELDETDKEVPSGRAFSITIRIRK